MSHLTGERAIEYLLWRESLDDGETTTVYAVRYPIRRTRVRVVFFPAPRRHLDIVHNWL